MSDFKCDATTRAQLDAPNITKIQHANVINTALGATRRIRMKHDTNPTAVDPWISGTEFRNTASTGSLKISGGRVTGLGRLRASTIKGSADCSVGSAVCRIEGTDPQGNARWIQVSVGGPGSAKDIKARGPFTPTNGLALDVDFAISGPAFAPSGTGPVAPATLDADAPTKFRVITFPNGVRTVSATAHCNVRDLDMVFDHPQLANEMGDIRIQRLADGAGIVIGTGGDCFKFAMTVFCMNKSRNSENPNKHVYQTYVNACPWNRWTGFPYRGTFDMANDTLSPQPFKVEILTESGQVLHTHELYSTRVNDADGTGAAINDPNHHRQFWATDVPCRPYWTCQMTLKWQSARQLPNSKRTHYCPPVDADSNDDRNVVSFDAAPEQWPLITGNYLTNGLGSWRVAPKWSRKRGGGFDTADIDPYFNQPARDDYVTQAIGYGYEPGSNGQHTWFMSPGGSRHDRHPFPHPVLKWITNPTGQRIHGKVALIDTTHHWMDNYFNEGCFYHTPSTLERAEQLDKAKIKRGNICYNDTYYNGGNEAFTTDIPNSAIRLLTASNQQHDGYYMDKYGRQFTNQYQRDDQHNIPTGALGVYIMASPIHAMAARASFNSSMACTFAYTQGSFDKKNFNTRQHAWMNWQIANQWMATTNDPRTFSRADVEEIWEQHLHSVYDSLVPEQEANQTVWAKMINAYGMHGSLSHNEPAKQFRYTMETDSKSFYMTPVMMLMKQSGSWERMRARSEKCRKVLDLIVTSLRKFSVDCFLDNKANVDAGFDYELKAGSYTTTLPDPSWSVYPGIDGLHDFITRPDGSPRTDTSYVEPFTGTQHLRAQTVWILNDYFPEIDNPRKAQAIAQIEPYYATVRNRMLTGTGNNWHWRFTNLGRFLPPAVIGPITT